MIAECELTVIFPKSVEDHVIDCLLEHPQWASGFTTGEAEGHGSSAASRTISELVRGRTRRVQARVVTSREGAAALVGALRSTVPSPEVAWWVVPVLEFGRLA